MNDREAIQRIMADYRFAGVFAYCCGERIYKSAGRSLTYCKSRNPPHAVIRLKAFGNVKLVASELDQVSTKEELAELILNSIAMQSMQS